MDVDLYRPPETPIQAQPSEQAGALAGRGRRLQAVLVDLLTLIAAGLAGGALAGALGIAGAPQSDMESASALVTVLALGALNVYLLHRGGQTVGKRLLRIRIERTDGSPAHVLRVLFLRYGVPTLIGFIPVLGVAFSVADPLFIFRHDRRCLHDLLADTRVVNAWA